MLVGHQGHRKLAQDPRWTFPFQGRAKSRKLHEVFSSYRNGDLPEDKKLKCMSSELLGLFGLLRHYVETRLADVAGIDAERSSFLAVCRCLDILLAAKRGTGAPQNMADPLQAALASHLELHKAAYGDTWLRPKHHWMMDIPGQLRRDKVIVDTFVIERHHNQIKMLAEPIKNTLTFEESLLAGVLVVGQRSQPKQYSGLQGRAVPLPGHAGVLVSDRLLFDGLVVATNDIVFNGATPGLVLACCSELGEVMVVVDPLRLLRGLSAHSAVYEHRAGDLLEVWGARDLSPALGWYSADDGALTVLQC